MPYLLLYKMERLTKPKMAAGYKISMHS